MLSNKTTIRIPSPAPADNDDGLLYAWGPADWSIHRAQWAAEGRDQWGNLQSAVTVPWTPVRDSAEFRSANRAFGAAHAELWAREQDGQSWWSLFGAELDVLQAAEVELYCATEAQRKAALALLVASKKQETAAEIVAIQARRNLKRGEEVKKHLTPCSRLYSCVGDKSSGGAKPTTRHISSECWSHERTCPQTRTVIAKHVCPWLHPGEAGWHNEWSTDRMWKSPEMLAATAAKSAPAAPTRAWDQTATTVRASRWGALAPAASAPVSAPVARFAALLEPRARPLPLGAVVAAAPAPEMERPVFADTGKDAW